MNLLILSGQIYPYNNNAAILRKLLPFFQEKHDVRMIGTFRPGVSVSALPSTIDGIPVYWRYTKPAGFPLNIMKSSFSKMVDPGGNSDALIMKEYTGLIRKIDKEWKISAILSITEPFSAAAASAGIRKKNLKKGVYIMDPPPTVRGLPDTPFRKRWLSRILRQHDAIFSTPFMREAISANGFGEFADKVRCVGFPMITGRSAFTASPKAAGRIRLLFCGWLYSDIRSPKYFLEILSRLDARFSVTFMGKECEKLRNQFDVQTKAELITLPQQPYEAALQAMADADVMINIGNNVSVHIPSKTLEYINTGKPFVNFYKMDDCPTLYYTKRYPLCLNLSEQDPDLDAAAARFMEFCFSNRGKTVDRSYIETEFTECTPKYISQTILDALGE